MKFAEKYEIIEMVTSGRVSTFLAKDRTTQDPVVVYTFECVGTSDDLSTASIIARFCSLAPNPPGIIVKAGFDEPSSSAFITTKMPETEQLKEWVRAYHSSSSAPLRPVQESRTPSPDETAELSAAEVQATLAKSRAQKQPPPQQPLQKQAPQDESPLEGSSDGTGAFQLGGLGSPQSAGEFTRLFREANAFEPIHGNRPTTPSKSGDATDAMFGHRSGSPRNETSAPPPAVPPSPAQSSPGSFTKEFLAMAGDKAEPVTRRSPIPPAPPAQKEPGAFTKEFLAVSQESLKSEDKPPGESTGSPPPARNPQSSFTGFGSMFGSTNETGASPDTLPAEPPRTGADSQRDGTGEFTSFFRGGPFDNPGPQEKSFNVPDLSTAAPSKQPTGEYTKFFGKDDLGGGPSSAPPVEPEPRPTPGSFTQLFSESAPTKGGAQLGSSTLDTHPGLRRPSGPVSIPLTPVQPPPREDFFAPASQPPVRPQTDQAFSNRARPSESSTEVFRRPSDTPPAEETPSGPSDFTMFISRSQLGAMLPPEPAPPSGAPAPAPLPGFAAPPIPQPAMPQFAPPPPPAPPAVKLPPVPTPPAAPKMPAVAAPPKAASLWPLITVLTILIAIGALLVMYFALKH